ncbi:MAG TPA: hypothetical protein VMV89_10205 [Candidatus Paceibacterota bacterium]|nr:hypothetical protein [Candidatus Paceibacterota bacterium]
MPATYKEVLVSVDAIAAKRAAEAAWNYFHALFPSKSRDEVGLEEIEATSDGRSWLVTLSFEEVRKKSSKLPDFLQVPARKLKIF